MLRLHFIFLAVCVFITAASSTYAGSVYFPGTGHYYDLIMPGGAHPTNYTWFEARDLSASMTHLGSTGHLATVTSSAESQFLYSTFSSQIVPDLRFAGGGRGSIVWIGLNDAASEGSYQWITGEPFAYSSWLPPEPNNLGNEDYVHYFYRDYGSGPIWGWNDSVAILQDFETVGFFVEFDGPFVTSVPEPSTIALSLVGLTGLVPVTRLLRRQ